MPKTMSFDEFIPPDKNTMSFDEFIPQKEQPPGAVDRAIGLAGEAVQPITDLPSTYGQMVRNAREQMSSGVATMGEGGVINTLKGAGQTVLGAMGYVGAPIAAPIHTIVGEPVRKTTEYATGSPTAGKIAGTSAEIGASFFTPIPKGLPKAATRTVPTTEEIKAAAEAGFESPEIKSLVFDPRAIKWWSDHAETHLSDLGIDENLAPKTWSVLQKLKNPPPGSTIDGRGLASLRRTLGHAAGSTDPTERLAATEMIESLDSSIGLLPSNFLLSGDPKKASEIWAKARQNYSIAKHAERIQDLTERGKDVAGKTYSGQNIDNAMRQEIDRILRDPKKQRGYTDAEIEQMRLIVRGTPMSNLPRTAGKLLGGHGGFPAMIAASAGGAAGAHEGGLIGMALGGGAPAIGYAFKKIGDSITKGRVQALDEMIRSRSPLAQEVQTQMANYGQAAQNLSKSSTGENLARLFSASSSLSTALSQAGVKITPHELVEAGARADERQ